MLKTKRQILATVYFLQTTLPSDSVKLRLKISLPLSLSIRGHPCSNQQFISPIISEKFVVSELTFVSTQLIFSLDQPRDRRPD